MDLKNIFVLAELLHKTATEIYNTMSIDEYLLWIAYLNAKK